MPIRAGSFAGMREKDATNWAHKLFAVNPTCYDAPLAGDKAGWIEGL
jgi:hypothetical protein